MLTHILLSISALICFYLSYRYAVARPKGFPPGPPRIPVFGSYLFMMMSNFKYLHKAVLKFTKWYKSDIVGFHIGQIPVVTVHSAEAVREVLNNSSFDGRPQIYLAKMRAPSQEVRGIFFPEGALWKEQRRFVLRYLRDFGFGRRFQELELVIQEEITEMLDLIRNGPRYEHEKQILQKGGYRVMLPYIFDPFTANSLLHIMHNIRYPRSEQSELLMLIKKMMQFQRHADDYGKMISIIPWIRFVFPNWCSYNQLMDSNRFAYKFFGKLIDHHIETFDESGERNFLDLYIKKMKQAESESMQDPSTFSREQFIMAMIDFSFPPFTAIGTQISLLVQHLLMHPGIQRRIQKEIDEVVGTGRLPTLEDRKNMHYTEATIREGLRIETLLPSNVPHKTLVDTQLMGYNLPKDTVVITSLYAYHNDKRIWGDPENFRPERFLDDLGHFSLKKDVSLPFGAGKRLCPGETFARNMLFLMVSALCQNFTFVLGPNDKKPDLSKNLSGLIISPQDFWVQLKERS